MVRPRGPFVLSVVAASTGLGLAMALIGFLAANRLVSRSLEPLSARTAAVHGAVVKPGLPVRLKIPRIKVDAGVEPVGLASNGDMDVPKSLDSVGWLSRGQHPGQIGSAVLAGHYGQTQNGKVPVFNDLAKLRPGDKLFVKDDRGVVTAFVVSSIRTYDPKADAAAVFGSSDGKSHLSLITCRGEWNQKTNMYTQRLVVFANKIR